MRLFSIVFLLALGLSGCGSDGGGSSDRERKEGWTELTLKQWKDGCVDSALNPSSGGDDTCPNLTLTEILTPSMARTACNCLIDEISYRFTEDEAYYWTCAVMDILEKEGIYDQCSKEAGIK